jgi:hypothetical protein
MCRPDPTTPVIADEVPGLLLRQGIDPTGR